MEMKTNQNTKREKNREKWKRKRQFIFKKFKTKKILETR
jgi:hypothetical protein